MNLRRLLFVSLLPFLLSSSPSGAKVQIVSKDPYLGAVVVDAESGRTLFASNADAKGYPASVLKLMDLLIILEKIDQGFIRLDDLITVSGEVSKIGGSQVYLKEKEVFTVEELLYALMIQSANDAAAALAIHVGGSKEGFVALMNEKARELGMTSTMFHSVHGLPPSPGGDPDVTTANDLAKLCLALTRHPKVLAYTSVKERGFRNNTFIMRNHNHLLGSFDGCDGFKTGFFSAAGFSICATAERKGVRIIAVILGSKARKVRDARAAELLQKGFLLVPPKLETPKPAAVPAVTNAEPAVDDEDAAEAAAAADESCGSGRSGSSLVLGIFIGLGMAGAISLVSKLMRKREEDQHPRIGRPR
ncbi:MAG: D-alanyl-D-alanine carboxypeptidase family protein [bacterium]